MLAITQVQWMNVRDYCKAPSTHRLNLGVCVRNHMKSKMSLHKGEKANNLITNYSLLQPAILRASFYA